MALHLAKRLSSLRLEDATASVQKDKEMIDSLVAQMPGGFEAMNRFVKSNIAEEGKRVEIRSRDKRWRSVLTSYS